MIAELKRPNPCKGGELKKKKINFRVAEPDKGIMRGKKKSYPTLSLSPVLYHRRGENDCPRP